ncbi:diversity-generating retroelement protein Avd [Patescibacteria group bacterium]|nr:diversity-generating retroelement protein Avd [Patescibacteria group bacterium]
MTTEKLIIFQKIYDFLLWLYPLINRIPKSHRLVLGKHIEDLGVGLLLLSIQANKTRDGSRKEEQLAMSDELDKLRILIRLTKDLRFISISQYQYAAEKTNEIGRILYGWMRSNRNF